MYYERAMAMLHVKSALNGNFQIKKQFEKIVQFGVARCTSWNCWSLDTRSEYLRHGIS